MPIYEYRCAACGGEFEVLQSVGADGRDLECPECGATRAERMLSTFSASTGSHGDGSAGGGRGCGGGGFT
jgi:putative FmdB family regulatory protein